MKQYLAVFNSDQVNAYGIRMPVGTLASALEQGWLTGQPMFLSHDRHRLEGWTRSLGLHLEPALTRLTGLCCLPETEAEGEELKQFVYGFFGRMIATLVEPHRAALEARLAAALRGGEEPVYMDAAALYGRGLAERAFPDVFAGRDKDGLVLLKDLNPVVPGVFEQGGLLFFASSFLRRSLSRHNTLNDALLGRLQALTGNPELTVKVRLDPDVVGLAETYRRPLEFAYWWGPKFDDDLLSIPAGITQHGAGDLQRVFSGVSRTEFWWHEQNDLKTLECEEVLDIPSMGVGRDVYGCRYAHSIVDPQTKKPFHLDGAIRLYTEERMVERLEKTMYTAGRHSEYTKLWRVDGPVPIPLWKELITHHYRDNELVGEYLGGKDESGHLRPEVLNPALDPIYRFVPCTMAAGDGVRVSIGYHLPPDGEGPPVQVVPLDTWGTAEGRSYYVEADTFEVVKLLRREGVEVSVPDGVKRLAFEDTVVNLSLLLHRGADAAAAAERTLRAVRALSDAWVSRGDDRVVSFNVGVVYPDRTVYLSYAGHVVDVKKLFDAFGTSVPPSPGEIGGWAEAVLAKLTALFPPPGDVPRLARMLLHDGILQFERKRIDRSLYELHRNESGRPRLLFAIPREETDLVELISAGRVSYAELWMINRSECSACGRDYLACTCSKYLDEGVTQLMAEAELCDFFWTNRPAAGRVHVVPPE